MSGESGKERPLTGEAQEEALALLESSHEAAFGTLEGTTPFLSSVGYLYQRPRPASVGFRAVYLLLSDLARHTRNAKAHSSVSLLIMEKNSDLPVHEKKRVSLQGDLTAVEGPAEFAALKDRYLECFPRAQIFFTLRDFRFYKVSIREIHWIGGFGKAAAWRV